MNCVAIQLDKKIDSSLKKSIDFVVHFVAMEKFMSFIYENYRFVSNFLIVPIFSGKNCFFHILRIFSWNLTSFSETKKSGNLAALFEFYTLLV